MKSDLEALTELNDAYISSVQNSDVQRFDQLLAPEFYCSNPDGSLVDRPTFLKQTAQPVTIRGLSIDDVRIRLLGDVASSMPGHRGRNRTASRAMAAILMSGRARTAAGKPSRPM